MGIDSEEKKKLSKKITWISILLIAILSLVLSLSVYIYYQIDPLVSARLKETISSSTNGLYTISFSKLSTNPFTGNVIIRDIVFKPNPQVYNQFKKDRINPSHLYEIRVNALKLRQVHPLKVYLKRDLVINSILIEKPSVRVYYDRTIEKDSSKVDTRTTWQRLSKYLSSIKVGTVLFKEIDFKYIDQRLRKPEINGIKNLSITIKDILIDSLSHTDTSRFYHTRDILVEVFDNRFESPNKMYSIGFDKLEMSTLNKYARVTGLRVLPKFSEIPFSLKFGYRTARYLVELGEASLMGINYKMLVEKRQLHASSLNISKAQLDVFMNKKRPKEPGDLGKNFPQLLLKQLRLSSSIDTIKLGNSSLSYTEYDPYTAKKGKITLTAFNGYLSNVTNDSLALLQNPWSRGKFTAFLYGKGRLDFDINFHLTSPAQKYNYSGKLHNMQAKYFNQITRPLALLDIASGEADSATFSVNADYRNASGKMTIFYQDLNIGILKLNRNKKLQRNTLLSLVANNLLLKEDNPSKGEAPRTGTISYTRPDSVSFYSMIWKSLFSGIKENIGMTPEREKSLQMQFESFKPDGPPKTRIERKLQRDERRKRRENRKK